MCGFLSSFTNCVVTTSGLPSRLVYECDNNTIIQYSQKLYIFIYPFFYLLFYLWSHHHQPACRPITGCLLFGKTMKSSKSIIINWFPVNRIACMLGFGLYRLTNQFPAQIFRNILQNNGHTSHLDLGSVRRNMRPEMASTTTASSDDERSSSITHFTRSWSTTDYGLSDTLSTPPRKARGVCTLTSSVLLFLLLCICVWTPSAEARNHPGMIVDPAPYGNDFHYMSLLTPDRWLIS